MQTIFKQFLQIKPTSFIQGFPRFSYHEKVIEHFERPKNVGSLDSKKKNVGTGIVGAPACGDVMKLQIQVSEDGKTIENAVFKTFGCGSAIASSSYASELIKGMTLDEAEHIKNSGKFGSNSLDIAQYLKLPPVKLHCSMLAEEAIKSAIYDLKKKNSDEVPENPKEEAEKQQNP